jgi:hypothetical protein
VHRFSLALLILALFGVSLPAFAQEADSPALDSPLRGFSPDEMARIEPLLDDGVVALVEQNQMLPGIHLAAIVHAPADSIADIVAAPSEYPRFMPAVSDVTERERHETTVAFSWRWRTSIFALGGEATLTRFSPPPEQSIRGHRVVIERTSGDLGQGRDVWRIIPRGPRESLVTLSTRMDLREANYLTRNMGSASNSLSRSINLAMAFGTLSRTKIEAERRASFVAPPVERVLDRPDIDLRRVEPLLRRGDLLLVEIDGTELVQAAVATRVRHEEARVRQIILDPVSFTQALINGSQASVRQRGEDGTLFDWRVDMPLVGTSGTMRLREAEDRRIHLDAEGGALAGGRWRFETQPGVAANVTMVLGWASFDVGDANFLLRAVVDADPAFRPGLSAATEIMMARALRIRLSRPDPAPTAR